MTKIKAIIFDAGGVLLDGHGSRFIKNVEQELGVKAVHNPEEHGGAVFGRGMQLGQRDPKDQLNEVFGGNLDEKQVDRVVEIFEAEWPQDPKMVALAKNLRNKYKVALLSNTELTHVDLWKRNGFMDIFDETVVSNEVHLLKPDEKIYLLILEKLGLKGEECVFIDDILENTEAAEKLGIKGIQFKNIEQCKADLRKIGVEF